MKKVYLQYWEESERGWGVRPDGCSLHLTIESVKNYINSIWSLRTEIIPNEYDRIIGEPIEVMLKDNLYDYLVNNNVVRLFQYELNNLLKFEEIIIL